jgi:hypothetical protein
VFDETAVGLHDATCYVCGNVREQARAGHRWVDLLEPQFPADSAPAGPS